MKQVLLTGASGFVGRYIQKELSTACEVMTIGRSEWDIRLPPTKNVMTRLSSVVGVVHAAALTAKSKKDNAPEKQAAYTQINVVGTKNLLTALAESPLAHFIYVSTLDVYGDTKNSIITENTPTHPQTFYAKTKRVAELACQAWCAKRNIPFAIARLAIVYGEGEESYEKAIPVFIKTALGKKPIPLMGKGAAIRDVVHASDVARAIALIAQKKVTGIYNIASGKGVSMRELAFKINSLTGNPKDHISYIQKDTRETQIQFDVTRLAKLGFQPVVSLDEGLGSEIQSFAKL